MAQVAKSVLLTHSAAAMFALVDDVESYPLFLPWCRSVNVQYRSHSETIATLNIDYHHVRQSFTTRNVKQAPERMDLSLKEGPFRSLQGHWRFAALGEHACRVEFFLEYEFSSRILDKLLAPVFSHIANTLVDAFVRRADQLHLA